MGKFESFPERSKSREEQLLESPDGQEAMRRIKERRVNNFLESVRGADSVEEAMRYAPGTNPEPLSLLLDAKGRKKAEEVAREAQEKWRPVLEKIRGAADKSKARESLGELEQTLGEGNLLAVLEEVIKISEERKGNE